MGQAEDEEEQEAWLLDAPGAREVPRGTGAVWDEGVPWHRRGRLAGDVHGNPHGDASEVARAEALPSREAGHRLSDALHERQLSLQTSAEPPDVKDSM
mmetsp:Transcript_115482/g.172549  ORF Transcript_115482/g.172549 Transcript_115482/m.172549 type:complete len:98 (-) Transcript_115482:34-327(-)